jgi:hypothetical protein
MKLLHRKRESQRQPDVLHEMSTSFVQLLKLLFYFCCYCYYSVVDSDDDDDDGDGGGGGGYGKAQL